MRRNHIDKRLGRCSIWEAFETRKFADIYRDNWKGHIVKLKMKTKIMFAIADSRSPMSILNKKTLHKNNLQAWEEEQEDEIETSTRSQIETSMNLTCNKSIRNFIQHRAQKSTRPLYMPALQIPTVEKTRHRRARPGAHKRSATP